MNGSTPPNGKTIETTVGRTPWDAGAILLLVLGRAVPYVTILAVAVYAIVEVSKADSRARTAAIEEYATRIEKLIEFQESGFKQYESLRTGQIDTLNKLSALTNSLINSTEANLSSIIEMQQKVEEENDKLAQAQAEIETTRRKVDTQSQRADELGRQLVGAEARLDLAFRITEYVISSDNDHTPRLVLTTLSEIFEGSEPDAVRTGASGERFYGSYRITATEMNKFLDYCNRTYPEIFALLDNAGGQEGAQSGSEKFSSTWAGLSRNRDFSAAQTNYVRENFYVPFRAELESKIEARIPGSDTNTLLDSISIQAVIWSTAIQHGLRKDLIASVVSQFDEVPTPEAFIDVIYDERRNVDYYFPNEPSEMRRVLEARYVFERRAALDMLAEERSKSQKGSTE